MLRLIVFSFALPASLPHCLTHYAVLSLPCETVVILAKYCMMILVASVLPDPLSPLMMMDWFEALAFLARTSALVSESASKCPFTCQQQQHHHQPETEQEYEHEHEQQTKTMQQCTTARKRAREREDERLQGRALNGAKPRNSKTALGKLKLPL